MTVAAQTLPTSRTVVLLRPDEKRKLQELALAERVSSGEIIRRSLHAYNPEVPLREEEDLSTVISEMNKALDKALKSVRSARIEVAQNIRNVQQLRAKHT